MMLKRQMMTILSNMSRRCLSKEFSEHLSIFVRPLIEQTKVHFKILELLVITVCTGC